MKSYPVLLLFLLSLFVYSCSDSLSDIGSGIQPASDQIALGKGVFHLTTENVFVESISSRPDSFLLGSLKDSKFGSLQADILAQVNCPEGFKFPKGSVADSASVLMRYTTWFGSKYSPMDVNIYEMNKGTFSYSTPYLTNLNPEDYCDRSIKIGERIFSAKDAGKVRTDTTAIRFKLTDAFVKRFFDDSYFASTTKFLDHFKGIYITSNYGSSSLLNISQIDLRYYYHYTYQTKDMNGKDSTATVKSYIVFPANSEVRQVNLFKHDADYRASVVIPDSVNYISSPANIQARVNIPMHQIQHKLDSAVNGKKLTINSAIMRVEVTNTEEDTVLHPVVSHMLLVRESAKDRFFKNKELPSDTCAIRGDYTTEEIGTTGVYKHYYSFNIATLLATQIKKYGSAVAEYIPMRLVPVKIKTTTSTSGTASYVSVKEDYLMSAVTIRSGKNTYSPMRINVVYSGF